MSDWKRVCCAVDFSDPSKLALNEAAEPTRRAEGDLTILHVHVASPAVAGDLLQPAPEIFGLEEEELERELAACRAEAERILGRPVRTALVAGNAAAEIVRFARREPLDLLVLATHGRTGLGRLIMGSVAERVVRNAPCAVLVVRPREQSRAEDVEEAAMYGAP